MSCILYLFQFFFYPSGTCLVVYDMFFSSIPSVTEIGAMLHTSRQDNTSSALLQLHTAPNCQYKVIGAHFFIRFDFFYPTMRVTNIKFGINADLVARLLPQSARTGTTA